jgi:hypothetical protein
VSLPSNGRSFKTLMLVSTGMIMSGKQLQSSMIYSLLKMRLMPHLWKPIADITSSNHTLAESHAFYSQRHCLHQWTNLSLGGINHLTWGLVSSQPPLFEFLFLWSVNTFSCIAGISMASLKTIQCIKKPLHLDKLESLPRFAMSTAA